MSSYAGQIETGDGSISPIGSTLYGSRHSGKGETLNKSQNSIVEVTIEAILGE